MNETNMYKKTALLDSDLLTHVTELLLQRYLLLIISLVWYKEFHTCNMLYIRRVFVTTYVRTLCIYRGHSYLTVLDDVNRSTASAFTYFHVYDKRDWCERRLRDKEILLRDCPLKFQRDFITNLVIAKYSRKLTNPFGYAAVKLMRFYLWHCHLCSERGSMVSFMCLPYGTSLLVNYCSLPHFVFKLTWSICSFFAFLSSRSTCCCCIQFENWIWCSEHGVTKHAICYVGIHKYACLIHVFVFIYVWRNKSGRCILYMIKSL